MKTRVQFASILIAATMFFAAPASAATPFNDLKWCVNNLQTCVKDNWGKVVIATVAMFAVPKMIIHFKKPQATPAGTSALKTDADTKQPQDLGGEDQETDGTNTPESDASTQAHKYSGKNDDDDTVDGAPLLWDDGTSLATMGIRNLNSANAQIENRVRDEVAVEELIRQRIVPALQRLQALFEQRIPYALSEQEHEIYLQTTTSQPGTEVPSEHNLQGALHEVQSLQILIEQRQLLSLPQVEEALRQTVQALQELLERRQTLLSTSEEEVVQQILQALRSHNYF